MGTFLPSPPWLPGHTPIAAAPQFGLRWLGLGRLCLPEAGSEYTLETAGDEVGLDLLQGVGTVAARGPWGQVEYAQVRRSSAFEGPPVMLYLPRHCVARVTCISGPLEAVVFRAASRRDTQPRLIEAAASEAQAFGQSNWARTVYASLGPKVEADRLVMGETHTPSGNWSSYPPHKHDREQPPEKVSEEIYHFLIDPPFGFGLQTLWRPPSRTEALEQAAYPVHNGDTVIIPSGYHPVVVAPGFRMITVWAYAGDSRAWGAWAAEPAYARLLERFDPHSDGDAG